MRFARRLILIFLGLGGCTVGPNYQRPSAIVSSAYKEAPPGWTFAKPADAIPKGAWWTVFHDRTLDAIEPQVMASNQTLKQDYYAYQQSLAAVREARAGLFPTLSFNSSVQEAKASAGSSGGSAPTSSGSALLSSAWTLDVWGKVRRAVEGGAAAAQVSAADLANARLSAQAAVASDYFALRATDANAALLRRTVAAYTRTLSITLNQAAAGVAPPSDVITARTQLDNARAALINVGVARAQYEHAIAVLIGRPPSAFSLPPGTLPSAALRVPPGLPAALLERRPDIAAAERTMAEANAQIGVAVAAFYPTISLTGTFGYAASPLHLLFSAPTQIWSLGAAASEAVFEGGARTAAVSSAKASYNAQVAAYRQTVLTALQQVEDDLSSLRILAQQAKVESAAVAAANRAVRIALNEYEAGSQAYTTVVTAQATALSTEQTSVNVRLQRLQAGVALIEALGGGWSDADLPNGAAIRSGVPVQPLSPAPTF